jgi:hypothetical protein
MLFIRPNPAKSGHRNHKLGPERRVRARAAYNRQDDEWFNCLVARAVRGRSVNLGQPWSTLVNPIFFKKRCQNW